MKFVFHALDIQFHAIIESLVIFNLMFHYQTIIITAVSKKGDIRVMFWYAVLDAG